MSNIILPDDPEWNQPLKMNNPYEGEHLPPKMAQQKRIEDLEVNSGGMRYGASQIAHVPDPWFTRMSQATGVSNMMTQPMWFSPLHTPQNWQIASKRREIYQWNLLKSCEILTNNFTYKLIADLDFQSKEAIEDTLTGGLLYDNIESEQILAGKGKFRKPRRFSVRECKDKRCFALHAYGYWRTVEVSEEHPMIILHGKTYRHKKKLEADRAYKRSKGIPKGGDKPEIQFPEQIIGRKEAQNVDVKDYLLAPVPAVGKKSICSNDAWMVGLCIADGTIGKCVAFTMDKNESHRHVLEKCLENRFYSDRCERYGIISSKKHGEGNGWRINACTTTAIEFFDSYITGKHTEKRFRSDVFELDRESRLHVLGGYFAGDGSFSKQEGKLLANNYSCDMADQLYWLLLSVGIRASLGRYPLYGDHYETNSKWCYRLFIPQTDILKLKPYMRSDKIPDDFEPANIRELRFFYEEDGVNYLAQPIESIKQFLYTGPGYDLQIDPERSFVASGYVTSNCRFFFESDPKVAAAIDFYSRFPMNNFSLECKSRKVMKFFKHKVVDKLKLNEQFKMISSEYFMMGDVFVHTDIECKQCKGSGVDGHGEICNHPGGNVKRMIILNPDWIEVQQNVLADEPAIVMVPDEELKRIVFYKQPKIVYDRIPEAVKELVAQNKPIPLSNRTMSHLKHMPVPYGTYGTSLIRRLFTTLAYKTKMMTANWIVAERLIIPVRVVKIGSDNRPASSADIADVQNQLANVANDPNMTIVTHHNFEYEWYGTTGKVLQITQEMEWVGKEILDGFMLNQALLNGEMCIPEKDRMLTKNGFKNLDQISEDDEIATYNKNTGALEYQKPTDIHVYDYDDDLIHFQTDRIDFMCTPNHKMLYQKRDHDEWIVDTADKVRDRAKFIKTIGWIEKYQRTPLPQRIDGVYICMGDMLKIAAYYVSEGHIQKETRKERSTYGDPMSVQIAQTEKGKGWEDLCTLRKECSIKISKTRHGFAIHNKKFAKFMTEWCGVLSHNKRVPQEIKDLPKKDLEIFLGYLINGDGSLRTRDKHGPKKYYTYYTKSMQLRDDVMEIALKCGYFPRFRKRKIYEITFSDYDLNPEPLFLSKITLESKKHKTITKEHYKGRVWCVTVPNGFIVTERNGKLMISGNSGYQSAQVGVETLIRRIESWRHTLADWCQERIFKPIAEMQGFIDHEESEEIGDIVYLYPKIKWNDLNLKDKTQWYQLIMQLHDKGTISTQTLLEELDLDYDQEVKRKRFEMAQGGPGGAQMGQPAGAGGMPMGGAGGGMPGGDMMGGMPGGGMDGGMGGMPGGEMMGGGGMPGAMAPMGGGGAGGAGGKVLKKGKKAGGGDEEMMQPSQPIMLTTIEQTMAQLLSEVSNNLGIGVDKIMMQYPIQNPTGAKPYTLDFAIPHIKMGVETDGEVWHSSQEQVEDDQKRDTMLAQRGWTVLRFDDKVIEDAPQSVQETISSYIQKLHKHVGGGGKTASKDNGDVQLFTLDKNEKLAGFERDYVKYNQRGIHLHEIQFNSSEQ